MVDEDTQRKYLRLRADLRDIATDLGELNNRLDNLKTVIDNSIMINKKNPIQNTLSNVRRKTLDVKDDIKEDIIPRINRKL